MKIHNVMLYTTCHYNILLLTEENNSQVWCMVAMRVHPNKRKNSSRGWLVTKSGADKRANRGNIDLSDKPGDTDAYDTWLVAIPQINKYFFKILVQHQFKTGFILRSCCLYKYKSIFFARLQPESIQTQFDHRHSNMI